MYFLLLFFPAAISTTSIRLKLRERTMVDTVATTVGSLEYKQEAVADIA